MIHKSEAMCDSVKSTPSANRRSMQRGGGDWPEISQQCPAKFQKPEWHVPNLSEPSNQHVSSNPETKPHSHSINRSLYL